MSDSKFFLYIKKFLRNPLLARKQMAIQLIHHDMPNVTKSAVKEKLATMLKVKPESVSVFGLKTKFGGGRSSGFALVYDSQDQKKKYDMKMRSLNEGLISKPAGLQSRRAKKDIKIKKKKLRGKAKAGVTAGKKKR